MKFTAAHLMVAIMATVSSPVDAEGLRRLGKTKYCIQDNYGQPGADELPKYRRVNWNDQTKSRGNNEDKIVDMSVCQARLDEKSKVCVNDPKDGEEFRYHRKNWNLQDQAVKAHMVVDDAICVDHLDTKVRVCVNEPRANKNEEFRFHRPKWSVQAIHLSSKVVDDAECVAHLDEKERVCVNDPRANKNEEFRYMRPKWSLQERTQKAHKIVDESVCVEYLDVKKKYCVLSPVEAKHADKQPPMVHRLDNWNLQTSVFEGAKAHKTIVDDEICTEKKEYCSRYGTEAEPKYRRRNWTLPEAESRHKYPTIVDMAVCDGFEADIEAERQAAIDEKKRIEEEIQQSKDDRKKAKLEKDAIRKELIASRDLDEALAYSVASVENEDVKEDALEAAQNTLQECEEQTEDQDEEAEVECGAEPHDIKILTEDLRFSRQEVQKFARVVSKIQKALRREAESQARKAEKAAKRAARQAGKRARMLARKQRRKNNKRKRSGAKFPPREGTCFKDHICAKVSGDPHITTFDGLRYDCQGHGEFVLVRDLDSQLEVQGRFEDARTNTDGNMITITRAISIDTGVEVDGVSVPAIDVIAEELEGDGDACTINYYIDGKPANFGTAGTMTDREGNIVANAIPFLDENGTAIPGVELYDGNSDQLYFPDSGIAYSVLVRYGNFGCVLNNDFCMPASMAESNIVGLFGSPNKQKGDDWMDPEGNLVPHGGDLSDAHGYSYCTQNWCVTEEESIFAYMEDESWNTFYGCDRDFNPRTPSQVVNEPTEECQACCGEVEEGTARNDCLLECMEGDVLDCEAFKAVEEAFKKELSCSAEPPTDKSFSTTAQPKVTTVAPPTTTGAPPTTPDPITEEDRTTEQAFTKGDPHFKTFGGELYDYHGECDLVLLKNPHFKDNLGMEIHIRTKIEDFWSSVESAAIKIGDDILEIQANPESDEWLWLNGEAISAGVEAKAWQHSKMAGHLLRFKESGGASREANIYLGNQEVLELKTFKSFVRVDINWKESANYDGSTGLLGSHAHNGQRLGRDGTFLEDVNTFGQEWQVLETEGKLFHSYEGAVTAPNKCVLPPTWEEPAKQQLRQRRLAESGMTAADAEAACNHLVDAEEIKACVYDVIATQDLSMASAW